MQVQQNLMWRLVCPDNASLYDLIEQVQRFNTLRAPSKKIYLYFQRDVIRITSVVLIQKFWRGYAVRKTFNPIRIQRRASLVIQLRWRLYKARKNLHYLKKIKALADNKSRSKYFYLSVQQWRQLESFVSQEKLLDWFFISSASNIFQQRDIRIFETSNDPNQTRSNIPFFLRQVLQVPPTIFEPSDRSPSKYNTILARMAE